jgi:hypothetical protein
VRVGACRVCAGRPRSAGRARSQPPAEALCCAACPGEPRPQQPHAPPCRSAVKIQSVWRGRKERLAYGEQLRQHRAAARIQRCWRHHWARINMSAQIKRLKAAVTIQVHRPCPTHPPSAGGIQPAPRLPAAPLAGGRFACALSTPPTPSPLFPPHRHR